jgi:hypothetical protein
MDIIESEFSFGYYGIDDVNKHCLNIMGFEEPNDDLYKMYEITNWNPYKRYAHAILVLNEFYAYEFEKNRITNHGNFKDHESIYISVSTKDNKFMIEACGKTPAKLISLCSHKFFIQLDSNIQKRVVQNGLGNTSLTD